MGEPMSLDDTSLVGKEFGNYRLAEVLGKGGTSIVYRGVHKSIGSEVAIKVLRRSGSPAMVKRFFHEAVAASQIRHPGIATVFDYGQADDGVAYLVMELLQGENLGDRLRRRGRLDPVEAARLMRQVCGALIAAHDADIVHRDIKPQNLFVVRDADVVGGERVKVLDFGVAKLLAGDDAANPGDRKMLLGTPLYMAPEQFRGGQNGDRRTDVYQIGAVLYHLIMGRPPFPDVRERMRAAAADAPGIRPMLDGILPGMDGVILRCLQRDPERRYPDVRELEDDLRGCLWEPTNPTDQSPTIVQRIPDLRLREQRRPGPAEPAQGEPPKLRGAHTLASASVASGFFHAADLGRSDLGQSRMFKESGEFFQQVRQTFEFYRKHLDEEYRQLSAQIESAHRLWIACVGVGFVILMAGLVAVLLGAVTQGVVTSSASTVMYFIVRVFQKREDYYRQEKSVKIKYLQYGNDWLLLIQSIEAIPDAAERLEEQHRLARVLLDRIRGEHGPRAPDEPPPAARRRTERRTSASRRAAPPTPTPTPPPP
jgi:serine/threonine protein kinase